MKEIKRRIAESLFWIAWSRIILQGVSFLSTLIVARLLSPEDYGLMALASIWTGAVSSITELGLGAAIIQFQEVEEAELSGCFWLTMTLAGLAYFALYAVSPIIASWFASPRLSAVLRVVGLTLPLASLRVVPDNLLRKRLQFDKVSKAEIVSVMMTIPVGVGMAWTGAGVWALVAAALILPTTQTIVSFWYAWWWPTHKIGSARFHEMIRYSISTLGGRVCWLVYQQSDTFILGKVSGDAILGIYSMAKTLALLPLEKVASIVAQLTFPVMAELQKNPEGMQVSFVRAIRLLSCVTWPMFIGLAIVADDMVHLLLGQKWVLIVQPLRMLCVYGLFSSVALLFPPVLMAQYRAGLVFRFTFFQMTLMPLAFLGGALWAGAAGVALAWISVYPIALSWLASRTLRELSMTWRNFFTQLQPAAIACSLMALTLLGLGQIWTSWGMNVRLFRLVSTVLTGCLVYGIGLLWLGGSIRGEIKEVVGWILRRESETQTITSARPIL